MSEHHVQEERRNETTSERSRGRGEERETKKLNAAKVFWPTLYKTVRTKKK